MPGTAATAGCRQQREIPAPQRVLPLFSTQPNAIATLLLPLMITAIFELHNWTVRYSAKPDEERENHAATGCLPGLAERRALLAASCNMHPDQTGSAMVP